MLLEKAYAKSYKSYEVISSGGNPAFALKDLTGAPYITLTNLKKEEAW